MTTKVKAMWNGMEVTVLGVEQKTSFGDLVKIDCGDCTRIVNSNYIKILKNRRD